MSVQAREFEELHRQFASEKGIDRAVGLASYYADSLSGRTMASGEVYDPNLPLAAHRTLPFGTVVRVTRQDTGAQVIVRIADRGPFGRRRRLIDLSGAAAARLDMLQAGVVPVQIEIVGAFGREASRHP